MGRFSFYLLLCLFWACGSASTTPEEEQAEAFNQFSQLFEEVAVPYLLTDTALLNNKDTAQIRNEALIAAVPDSVTDKIFGAKARLRYMPLATIKRNDNETYYLVKAAGGSKRAAFLFVADAAHNFKGFIPFMVLDADATTRQVSQLEKNYTVSRNISRKLPAEPLAEGKEVFAYSTNTESFELIMTDPLDEPDRELINPIDTLAKTHKLAGDYRRNKNNLVSVRDGRKPGLLTIFIHIENNSGSCVGEIKGDAEILTPTTAIYRQAGDPCILNITFSKQGVILEEEEGCGSRRGLECKFDGTYPRKKEAKPKSNSADNAK